MEFADASEVLNRDYRSVGWLPPTLEGGKDRPVIVPSDAPVMVKPLTVAPKVACAGDNV